MKIRTYKDIFHSYLTLEWPEVEPNFREMVHTLPDHGLSCETVVYVPTKNMFMVYQSSPLLRQDWIQYYSEDGEILHSVEVNPVMETILSYSTLEIER